MSIVKKIFLFGLAALIISAASNPALCNVRLAFDSASLAFGDVSLAGTKTLTLEVWDTSLSSDIEIDRFDLTGTNPGDFSVTSDSATPFVALADSGNNVKIYVTFNPKANGTRSGFLKLETSDGMVFISLSGVGGARSKLAWSDSIIDFGLFGPDGARDTIIELYSIGLDSATISAIVIASTDLSFSERTVSGIQAPFMLAPGDSVAVDILFQGLLPIGEKGAQLIVYGATLNQAECDLEADVEYGNFSLVPDNVDFGTMYAGQVRDTTIMLVNAGETPIPMDFNNVGIDPSGDDFTLLSPLDTTIVIPPGGNIPLTIRANPGLNTSHVAQLYAISQSAAPNFESSSLIVSVVSPSLSAPSPQTLSYFCAISGPQNLTLSVSDTGSGSIVITNFISDYSNVVLLINPVCPDTIQPGEIQSLSVQFDPSKVVGNTFAIQALGGEKVMIADTVILQSKVSFATASISLSGPYNSTQGNFEIGTVTTLDPFDIDTIIVHISVADTNIATIDPAAIKLSSGAPSTSVITSIEPEQSGYDVTIASSSPIDLAAGRSLLTVGFSRYVSTADSSNVFLTIETPEKAGCLDWTIDTAMVPGAQVCGKNLMQDVMDGSPIILTAALQENPVTNSYANVAIFSNVGVSQVRYSLSNAIGENVINGTLDLISGQNNKIFSLSGLPSGQYILRILTADGFSTSLRILKLD